MRSQQNEVFEIELNESGRGTRTIFVSAPLRLTIQGLKTVGSLPSCLHNYFGAGAGTLLCIERHSGNDCHSYFIHSTAISRRSISRAAGRLARG